MEKRRHTLRRQSYPHIRPIHPKCTSSGHTSQWATLNLSSRICNLNGDISALPAFTRKPELSGYVVGGMNMHRQRYGDPPRGVVWEICSERGLEWSFHRSQVQGRVMLGSNVDGGDGDREDVEIVGALACDGLPSSQKLSLS